MSESLYHKYGGFAAVSQVVSDFYERILADDLLKPYFEGTEIDKLIDHQTKFMCQVLGGPADYKGRTLKASHMRFNITSDAFFRVAEHLTAALIAAGFEQDDIATVIGVVAGAKDDIVNERGAAVAAAAAAAAAAVATTGPADAPEAPVVHLAPASRPASDLPRLADAVTAPVRASGAADGAARVLEIRGRLEALDLAGIAEEFERQLRAPATGTLAFDERLLKLIEAEERHRRRKDCASRLKQAKLPIASSIDDIDGGAHRGLARSALTALATCRWIKDRHTVTLTGVTGVGKTYLAAALGVRACEEGYTTRYVTFRDLLESLSAATGRKSSARRAPPFEKVDLVIVDEWGFDGLDDDATRAFLAFVDSRQNRGGLVIISRKPVADWRALFSGDDAAAALMDRFVNGSFPIQLIGGSMRGKIGAFGADRETA